MYTHCGRVPAPSLHREPTNSLLCVTGVLFLLVKCRSISLPFNHNQCGHIKRTHKTHPLIKNDRRVKVTDLRRRFTGLGTGIERRGAGWKLLCSSNELLCTFQILSTPLKR